MSFSKENVIKVLDDQFLRLAEVAERDGLTVDEHCNLAEAMSHIVEAEYKIVSQNSIDDIQRNTREMLHKLLGQGRKEV